MTWKESLREALDRVVLIPLTFICGISGELLACTAEFLLGMADYLHNSRCERIYRRDVTKRAG